MLLNEESSAYYPLLIDGGLSNVLEGHGCDLDHQLWTASLIADQPEAIIRTHLEYLKAGAHCITTASYQASIAGLREKGFNSNEAKSLILKSVELAEIAIKRAINEGLIKTKPIIAASIGPYGAYLADGSEYRGNYGVSDETLVSFHQERINILDKSKADLLAIETIPSLQEANVLSDLTIQCDKPVWISFSCKDEQLLNDGSKITDAISIFRDHSRVFAVGVNCTQPQYISSLISSIKEFAGNKKIVVYPNSGEAYNARDKTWVGVSDPDAFIAMAEEWLGLGADIIGGCCRIGPSHIRALKQLLENK